jgi:hypothetical protein
MLSLARSCLGLSWDIFFNSMKQFILFLILTTSSCEPAFAQTPKDSLLAIGDSTLKQDSIQATDGAMLPFAKEFIHQGHKHHIPPALLAGFTQIESRFEQYATRTEAAYQKNPKVKKFAKAWSKTHHGIPTAETELQDRSRSYGLTQPMGELAREQGYDSTFLATLYIADNNIEQCAIKLDSLFKRYGKDTLAVISAYNMGSAKRSHGTFENAQYVYGVVMASHYYEKALHYANNSNSNKTLQLARRSGDTAHGNSGDAKPAMQQSDTTGLANKGNADGGGPIEIGYNLDSRYNPLRDLPSSKSEFLITARYLLIGIVGFVFLWACVFGFLAPIRRYYLAGTRHDLDLPRPSERHFLSRSETQFASANSRRSLHSH